VSVALKLFHFAGGQQKMIHSMLVSGSTAQPRAQDTSLILQQKQTWILLHIC